MKSNLESPASYLFICLLFFAHAYAAEKTTAMFQGNARHTGVYETGAVTHFKEVKFAFKTDGPVRSTPVIAGGKIFFGSGDGNVYALDASSGKELWRFSTGGAILSSPAAEDGVVYFTGKDGIVHAVDADGGKERWSFQLGRELPYQNGFDNFLSSPTIDGDVLYIGAGDGNLYALQKGSGSVVWKFQAGSRIRSSPAVANGMVFFGTVDGYLYALGKENGKQQWRFATDGSSLKFADYGFDRSAIISSPSISDSLVVFGCRDGVLYAVTIASGALAWKFDHKISWVISTPAIAGGMAYAGSSDAHFFQGVDLTNGHEQWRFKLKQPVWSSGAIAGRMVYFGDYSGILHALDRFTGSERWHFATGDRIFSSPVISNGTVYFGSDDGCLYALAGDSIEDTTMASLPAKAVYWQNTPGYKYFTLGTDEWIRDYFKSAGYQVVGDSALEQFMKKQSGTRAPSVVVFANHYFPQSIVGDTSANALVRKYLDAGGKIVLLGLNPLAYQRDSSYQVYGIDFAAPEKVFGLHYPGSSFDAIGLYGASVTPDGRRWGLDGWWVGLGWVEPREVSTVLALDENGKAAAWVKNYGGPEGTGLVQLAIPQDKHIDLYRIMRVAEYGLVR